MQVKTLQGGLKKATIEMILLQLLSESDKYGYQLTLECKNRSGGKFNILEGSMYPILYRLNNDGYVTSYEKKAGQRLTRVYYHLQPSGQEHLESLKKEYYNYTGVIHNLLEYMD